ncbi:MAG: hypothetical protein AB4290_19735 [Spirulina sp.]
MQLVKEAIASFPIESLSDEQILAASDRVDAIAMAKLPVPHCNLSISSQFLLRCKSIIY